MWFFLLDSGAGPLFRSLESHIAAAIPSDTCEWKRSYGRPNKHVRIDATFQPFDTQILDDYRRGEWCILKLPVLHIYVTECTDIDTYRNSVKEEIDRWLRTLAGYNCTDWMILLVETVDVKKTKNILPRTTVLDKMRLDFGAKHADRCISVLNPIKFEVKATESFRCLLNRIRHLMLVGYNKNITKYEELIRANREKRTQDGWSFIEYFLLQEKLAFVLDMLGLHSEALVQYDELDAMFSQFVFNTRFGVAEPWLAAFEKPIVEFHGITLNASAIERSRQKIIGNEASLLEFRSYMFERQAALLRSSDQHWQIAERLLPFIFVTLREIDALKNEFPVGSLACWQIVCALEVLGICDDHQAVSEAKDSSNTFQYTAPIWNVAKDKLHELGKLCGLLPGSTPTSEQLHIVVQLSAGIGDNIPNNDEEQPVLAAAVAAQRPPPSHSPGGGGSGGRRNQPKQSTTDRLKEALGSNTAFQKLFLELSELAISTYKHVSRLRSARLVGLDLGNFYCTLNEPQKAVSFFTDLLRELKMENWNYLASQTLLELASCYRKMNDSVLYTKTCAAISCCTDLEILVRTFYFDEFLVALKTMKQLPKHTAGDTTLSVVAIATAEDTDVVVPQTVLATLEDHFKLISIELLGAVDIVQVKAWAR